MLKPLSIFTTVFVALTISVPASAEPTTPLEGAKKGEHSAETFTPVAEELEKEMKLAPLNVLNDDDLVIVTAPHHVAKNVETLEDYTLIFTGTQQTTFTLTKKNATVLENTFDNISVEALSKVETSTSVTQNPTPTWGLDRLDSPTTLDDSFTYTQTGEGVTIYIVDTGVNNVGNEFGERLTEGYTFFDDEVGTADCEGHGTFIAGTAAAETFGVAKNATVVPVRVINCDKQGTSLSLIAGLSWIVNTHTGGPAVINMSLGTTEPSASINNAARTAFDNGFVVVAAAGNDSQSACLSSPAGEPSSITVGAVNINNQFANFSNFGECVDISGPGVNIVGLNFESDTTLLVGSGTSIAAPYTAGVVASLLEYNPNFTPEQVDIFLNQLSTKNMITSLPAGTPDRLLTLNSNRLVAPSFSLTTNFTTWNVGSQASGTATVTPNEAYGNETVLTVTGVPAGVNFTVEGTTVTFSGSPTTTGTYTILYRLEEGIHVRTVGRNVIVSDPTVITPRVNLSQSFFTIERVKPINLSTTVSFNEVFTNPTVTVSPGLPPGIRASVRGNQIVISGTTTRNGIFRANVTATEGTTVANRVITFSVTNPTYAPTTPRPEQTITDNNINLTVNVPNGFFRPTQYSFVLTRNGNIIATQTFNIRRTTTTVNYASQTLSSGNYTVTVVARNSAGESRPFTVSLNK